MKQTPNNQPCTTSCHSIASRHSREGGNLVNNANKPNINNLITSNIDVWTTAIKSKSRTGRGSNKTYELYGIKKLRALILDLAVRGLLVPQDPNDESASELLKKIAEEKEQLLKEGKIKKQKVLPEISEEEKPFELPKGWGFTRLGQIGWVTSSSRVHKKDWKGKGIPFYRAREIVKLSHNGFVENELFISNQLFEKFKINSFIPLENDLMITGVGTIGVPYIVKASDEFYFKDASVLIFKNIFGLFPQYLRLLMSSAYWNTIIHKGSMGTTVHTLTITRANPIILPIAPLKEQKRIVAKVDELMALCDQLEQQTDSSIKAHKLLVENLLNALTQAKDHKTFQQAWQRIAKHFDILFTTEHSIEQLKQTILQLAVMGKLVPQDPKDEPASQLLKKIAKEKEKLIKQGTIKKQKPLPEIREEEKLFELPDGWEWEKIATFTRVGTGSTPSRTNTEYYFPSEHNWVTSGETSADFIYETNEKVSTKAIDETNVSIYPKGTLIVAMYGQGKTRGQITELMIDAGTNQACAAICMIEQSIEHRQYIKLFFKKAYKEIRLHSAGGAQPNLNVGKISNTLIPVPPLKEQKRIVNKVTQLLKLCDTLKQNLNTQQTTTNRLADTIETGCWTINPQKNCREII